jgi:hypothetical protein
MKPCIILELESYSDEARHLEKQSQQLATMFLQEMQLHFEMIMANNRILKERYPCICMPNSFVSLCICKSEHHIIIEYIFLQLKLWQQKFCMWQYD